MPRYEGDVDEDGIHIGVTEAPVPREQLREAEVKAERPAKTRALRTPGTKR